MALAEPRRRTKWTLNPRGNIWANDTNKFGQKLMEKMGWEQGKVGFEIEILRVGGCVYRNNNRFVQILRIFLLLFCTFILYRARGFLGKIGHFAARYQVCPSRSAWPQNDFNPS